jgi:hypothetical protein
MERTRSIYAALFAFAVAVAPTLALAQAGGAPTTGGGAAPEAPGGTGAFTWFVVLAVAIVAVALFVLSSRRRRGPQHGAHR